MALTESEELELLELELAEASQNQKVPFKGPLANPIAGAIAGANRFNPARNVQAAAAGAFVDLLGGELPSREGFKKHYQQSKQFSEQAEAASPIAAAAGEIATSIPLYAAGAGALKAVPWLSGAKGAAGLAQTLARGSGAGAGVGQLKRGLEVDPKASAIDAALGAGGELVGAGIGKAVEKGQKIPPWIMNKVFKPSPNEVEARALYGAKTLGEQVLERGLSGSGDDFIRIAAEGKKTAGSQIDDIMQVIGGDKIDRTKAADAMQKILSVAEEAGDDEAAGTVKEIMTSFWRRGKMTAAEAQKMKVALGKQMKTYYENPYKLEPTKVKAQLAKASGLRQALEEQASSKGLNLKSANAEYGFFKDLGDVSRGVATKEAGGATLPLQQQLSGLTGLGLYGPAEGIAALAGTQMSKSPKALTKTAVTLDDLLELIGRMNTGTAPTVFSGANLLRD